MKEKVTVFWFRRDLSLEDNCALYYALKSGFLVVPIFIFDKNILEELPKNDARVSFIHQELEKINQELQKKGSNLYVFKGKPIDVFECLLQQYNIQSVYLNHDYEPYAIKRDKKIATFLKTKSIAFKTYKNHVIFEKNEVVKADSTPYKVFTPFSKKWMEKLNETTLEFYPSEQLFHHFKKGKKNDFPTLSVLGFQKSTQKLPKIYVDEQLIKNYEETRNFPSLDATSKLGIHLRFGSISIRKLVEIANNQSNKTFLKELIWREFFMQILWHFPNTVVDSFKPKYDRILWRNNEKEFEKWKSGNTGFPLVDAGMRELNATGFMHNRARILVGSFLCKHLLIDWRWGEAYFAEKLLDYEMASNIGNWQWVAGCGVDAAPYFRIFNPTTQILKFDKELKYIKKWVTEFQELTYPVPMVDHKEARERCLKVYKSALSE